MLRKKTGPRGPATPAARPGASHVTPPCLAAGGPEGTFPGGDGGDPGDMTQRCSRVVWACPQAGVASPLPLLSLLFPPSKHVRTHTCAHTPVRPVCARRLPTEGWVFPHKPPRCLPPCMPRSGDLGPAGRLGVRHPPGSLWGAWEQRSAADSRGCASGSPGVHALRTGRPARRPRGEGLRPPELRASALAGRGSAGQGCWSRDCTRVSPVQRGLPGHVVCGISPRAAGLWGNLRLPGHLLRLLAGVFSGPGGTGPLVWAAALESCMASDKPGGFPPRGHVCLRW